MKQIQLMLIRYKNDFAPLKVAGSPTQAFGDDEKNSVSFITSDIQDSLFKGRNDD